MKIIERFPLPWRVERKKNYADVIAADGKVIPWLSDIELGWTDTATGPYHDPEDHFEEIASLVAVVNKAEKEPRQMNETDQAFDALHKRLRTQKAALEAAEGFFKERVGVLYGIGHDIPTAAHATTVTRQIAEALREEDIEE